MSLFCCYFCDYDRDRSEVSLLSVHANTYLIGLIVVMYWCFLDAFGVAADRDHADSRPVCHLC